jgi:hypothetical protein
LKILSLADVVDGVAVGVAIVMKQNDMDVAGLDNVVVVNKHFGMNKKHITLSITLVLE